MYEATVQQIQATAYNLIQNSNSEMLSSAIVCLEDSIILFYKGQYRDSFVRALKSIAYTSGISHPEYVYYKKLLDFSAN